MCCVTDNMQASGQQSKSEGAVLRFAKCFTPMVILTCVLLVVVPAIMGKQDLKVHTKYSLCRHLHALLLRDFTEVLLHCASQTAFCHQNCSLQFLFLKRALSLIAFTIALALDGCSKA